MRQDNKKTILSWAMYDWANSAFATTVIAGFFPVFFKIMADHGFAALAEPVDIEYAGQIVQAVMGRSQHGLPI